MAMDKEQFEELCAAYVLEALDEDDHRLFEAALAEADQARRVAIEDRLVDRHLGIEQGAPRQDTVKRPAMPVGPVHHRRHGKASVDRCSEAHDAPHSLCGPSRQRTAQAIASNPTGSVHPV